MISVAMAYYNRKQHLINTLHSINKSVYKDFEVIIVDDGSDDEHRIDDLEKQFKFLKTIRIDKENKKHTNPCIPFNIAFGYCSGDIFILQNPECFHYDDVFQHVINNIEKNKYLVYSVINKNVVNVLKKINWNNNYSFEINKLIKININDNNDGQWYAHRIFRPAAINFCTAITKEDLIELNGFDERYAYGIERDDVEFLERVRRKKMNVVFVDSVVVIHQTHEQFSYNNKNSNKLRNINHNLYAETTAKENIIKANPNKIII